MAVHRRFPSNLMELERPMEMYANASSSSSSAVSSFQLLPYLLPGQLQLYTWFLHLRRLHYHQHPPPPPSLHLHPRVRLPSLAETTMNPIDIFAYHMVTMEMMGISGSIVCCYGAFAMISCVKMFFHVLTCIKRYLAIAHPITYLNLMKSGSGAIRNISIGCVWFICSGLVALRLLSRTNFTIILFFCNLVFSLIVISFCSLSVLRVLTRPGPGEKGGNKGKINAVKQWAFVTIMAIMAVLLHRFGRNLVCLALASSSVLSDSDG
ncbi:hypothetical protein L3Q82_016611 [Scortum barcoo]|uniref:Uncharacterized protein n=1 Tax=Scortum barcoo TaxID=214431 RepID=A0ACB8X955_9TELE|nr:hypothetical protein L3Q82_016611 [Scortum barcoo]